MRRSTLTPEFVEFIPTPLEEGKLYISCQYRTVLHLCACGCGTEICTPLHPTGWSLTFDGELVSLHPSVGNWSEECRSHYIIRNNRVVWGQDFPTDRIEQIRRKRLKDIALHYEAGKVPVDAPESDGRSSPGGVEGAPRALPAYRRWARSVVALVRRVVFGRR